MRLPTILLAAAAASLVPAEAGARPRARSSIGKVSGPAVPATVPTAVARRPERPSGGLVVVPAGRVFAPPAVAAGTGAGGAAVLWPAVAALATTSAISQDAVGRPEAQRKPDCASDRLVGAGAGFCAVN